MAVIWRRLPTGVWVAGLDREPSQDVWRPDFDASVEPSGVRGYWVVTVPDGTIQTGGALRTSRDAKREAERFLRHPGDFKRIVQGDEVVYVHKDRKKVLKEERAWARARRKNGGSLRLSNQGSGAVGELSRDVFAALDVLRQDLQALGAWGYLGFYVRSIEDYMKIVLAGEATDDDMWDLVKTADELASALEEDFGADADFDIPNVEAEAISLAHEIAQFSAELQLLVA